MNAYADRQGTLVDDPELAALAGASSSVRPELAAVAATLRTARCLVTVVAQEPTGARRQARLAVSPAVTAVVLSRPGSRHQLRTVPGDLVPLVVARVVRLGPTRRRRDRAVELCDEEFAALVDADEPGAVDALPNEHPLRTEYTNNGWAVWSVLCAWAAPGGAQQCRRLDVVDARTAGLWHASTADGRTTLTPTTPTLVWQQLTALLPGDDELDLTTGRFTA
jgi:hypothetical protein